MVDFRLKGAGGKATAKRFRTSPTYLNFERLLKSCDIILEIEVLTIVSHTTLAKQYDNYTSI